MTGELSPLMAIHAPSAHFLWATPERTGQEWGGRGGGSTREAHTSTVSDSSCPNPEDGWRECVGVCVCMYAAPLSASLGQPGRGLVGLQGPYINTSLPSGHLKPRLL